MTEKSEMRWRVLHRFEDGMSTYQTSDQMKWRVLHGFAGQES